MSSDVIFEHFSRCVYFLFVGGIISILEEIIIMQGEYSLNFHSTEKLYLVLLIYDHVVTSKYFLLKI